jgi:tetratricopeptide (TPR) repeat protein
LFVIARNSTFTYKGKPVKVQKVGRELGVRYVLEGSVQKSANKVRITAQLVDASSGHHLWAERYDRELKEIFALQDEITMKILSALQVKLTEGEQARIRGKGTDNLEAYVKLLQGIEYFYRFNKDGNVLARPLFEEATALDPDYAYAYVMTGWTHLLDMWYGWSKSPDKSMERAVELAQKTVSLDATLAGTRCLLGIIHLFKRQHEEAIAEEERAITLNPNLFDGHAHLGMALYSAGRPEEAIASLKKAIRRNPFPPSYYLHQLGHAYRLAGRYEEAIAAYKKALHRSPDNLSAHLGLTATYSLSGREEKARAAAAEALRVSPNLSLEAWGNSQFHKDPAVTERLLDELRKAGLK